MQLIRSTALAIFLAACFMAPNLPANSQIIGISINIAPPPLPIYVQPVIPAPGYIWVPGYWAWSDEIGFYWVPGTWILPPEPGLLWTPGYWGWSGGVYSFFPGYWGPHVGFYGGVNYGFGYTGVGYQGGYWSGGNFLYNRAVNNISNVSITNVYNKTVIVNNTSSVSYNGGPAGTAARATPAQLAAARERHVAATPLQMQHAQAAARDPAMSLAHNHGHPSVAATSHPGRFRGPGVVAAHPGKPIPAPSPKGHVVARPHVPANERKLPRATTPLKPQTTKPVAPVERFAKPHGAQKVTPPSARHLPPPARHVPPPQKTFKPQATRHVPPPQRTFKPQATRHVAPPRHFAAPPRRPPPQRFAAPHRPPRPPRRFAAPRRPPPPAAKRRCPPGQRCG